ncbi:RNA polymerase subunit AC19 [Podila horticola]|nr:RNA polymerase subunit AC19 [Podila horticola]
MSTEAAAVVPREVEENDKISIIPGTMTDPQCATFCLQDEDHTLGNALRWAIMKDPEVDFVSYSMPHPSEPKTNVRIQTTEKTTAIEAVTKGLGNVQGICSHIIQTFNTELMKGEFEYEDEEDK